MMNIQQALDNRIPRIRKSNWANPDAYIRLPLLADGKTGPWAELYDDRTQKDVLDVAPGSQKLCVFLPEVYLDGEYEVYDGSISDYEQDNYAKLYVEI